MRRQHPLLSPTGIVLTIILFLVLALLLWQTGGMIFNPGPLSAQSSGRETLGGVASHAELAECSHCHQPLETSQSDLCMACHTEIRQEIDGNGLHGRIPSVNRCYDCHPDHRGRDFDMVQAGMANFDHGITDFSLVRHQFDYRAVPMDCSGCHLEGNFDPNVSTCIQCHGEHDAVFVVQHESDFGAECLDCHDGVDRMIEFDHQVTAFPLEGKHTSLVCAQCHMAAVFEGLPSACADCHGEPDMHFGQFESDCGACHSPTGWAPATLEGQTFDHLTTTGFDLVRHGLDFQDQAISCSTCHTENFQLFSMQTCVECHSAEDPEYIQKHQAQFGSGCLDCHDGVDRMHDFDHNRVFLLDGRHAEVECTACHMEFVFQDTPNECIGCHAEPAVHAGVFGLACEACHTTSAWVPALLRSHSFPLDHGGEGEISCLTCHPSTYIQYTCDACHEPVEMQEEHQDEGIFDIVGQCVDCHPTGLEDES